MSFYYYEMKPATCELNKSDIPVILEKIKEELQVNERWAHYGWRNSLLNTTAETFSPIRDLWGIELEDTHDNFARPVFNDVYGSDFIPVLKDIVAPYMSEGAIYLTTGMDEIVISFENGICAKTPLFREENDNEETFEVKFNVNCIAKYMSQFQVPISLKGMPHAILRFINDNIDTAPLGELEWVRDLDSEPNSAVTITDILTFRDKEEVCV